MEISVVVPAYNETSRIGASLRAIHAYLSTREHEIIVVDDGSVDDTVHILQALASEIPSLKIIGHKPNRGKGYTVRQGMMEASGKLILMSDADLAAPIEELPKLEAALQSGDGLAIGSREGVGAVREVHQSFLRELGGRSLNRIIQALAVPGIHDTQCGFKMFTRDCARAVFPRCFLDGWSFDVEVIYLARRMGFKAVEVPIHWSHKEGSKVSPLMDGLRIVRDTMKIRFHHYDFGDADRAF